MEHGLPLSTGFESLHRWIATLPKRGIYRLHDDVVDFAALVKGRFAQSLMHGFG
jgi:DNA-binding winged helix-turn-helix (wHTH) protein